MKSTFLKLYTLPFVKNKKKELNIDFGESESLRSFFERKLLSLSKFTTLPFVNQVEIVINDLPAEISSMFIIEEKMTVSKVEILEFCDSIQSLIEHSNEPTEERSKQYDPKPNHQSVMQMDVVDFQKDEGSSAMDSIQSNSGRGGSGQSQMQMEIFDFQHDESSSAVDSLQSSSGRARTGAIARGKIGKRGRPRKSNLNQNKLLKSISEDVSSDYNFLDELSNSSQSTWTDI